ncbi:MAG: hypothetical protein ABJ327_11135 [Litoreibacter sp.]
MKIAIATIALALTAAAPIYAQSAAQRFALDQDSAAERVIRDTSLGDISVAQSHVAFGNDSAAERIVRKSASNVTRASGFGIRSRDRSENARARFALDNDSAAERNVFRK